ncbi:MAG TPA: hypothetical protein DD403_12595 [Pseudomonas sp.]|jgi:hypothetical protein|nr:hypothetical protein [Pseudomonas sp.]|tara:strand:- start:809 stop:1063 length:255 start_codon:yes stop_codon:yes gene_type:complete
MTDNDSPSLVEFKRHASSSKAGRSEYAGNVALARVGTELDSTLNFRVNSGLKEQFDLLCKREHSSVAREIKRFMTEAVRTQRLI